MWSKCFKTMAASSLLTIRTLRLAKSYGTLWNFIMWWNFSYIQMYVKFYHIRTNCLGFTAIVSCCCALLHSCTACKNLLPWWNCALITQYYMTPGRAGPMVQWLSQGRCTAHATHVDVLGERYDTLRNFMELYNGYDETGQLPMFKTGDPQRHAVEMHASPLYDLDIWPVTLKPFSAVPTHVINICGKFHWNLSTEYRDIASSEIRVNWEY